MHRGSENKNKTILLYGKVWIHTAVKRQASKDTNKKRRTKKSGAKKDSSQEKKK